MFNWLFGRRKIIVKKVFKVTYCNAASIDPVAKKATFDLEWLQEKLVLAEDKLAAQIEFSKSTTLWPNTYIKNIELVAELSVK